MCTDTSIDIFTKRSLISSWLELVKHLVTSVKKNDSNPLNYLSFPSSLFLREIEKMIKKTMIIRPKQSKHVKNAHANISMMLEKNLIY